MNNFFQRLRWNMAQGMQGRNGQDDIGGACIVLAIICIIAEFFTGAGILGTIAMVAVVYALFRQLSTNVAKRQQENRAFMEATKKPRRALQLLYKRVKNRKTTAYFTCKDCGAVYSLPKGKGTLRATCPQCKKITTHHT